MPIDVSLTGTNTPSGPGNNDIWPIDVSLTGTNTLSGPGNNDNEGILNNWTLTIRCSLMSNPG